MLLSKATSCIPWVLNHWLWRFYCVMIFCLSYNRTLSGNSWWMICSVDLCTKFLDRSFFINDMFFMFIMWVHTVLRTFYLSNQVFIQIVSYSFRYLAGVWVCAMACFLIVTVSVVRWWTAIGTQRCQWISRLRLDERSEWWLYEVRSWTAEVYLDSIIA